MGTKLVRVLVAEASRYLDDQTNQNWSQAVLLDWLNYAESAVCMVKPDAYSVTGVVTLAPGTKQTIPASGTGLGRLLRNMGTDGATPGEVITEMPIKVMDRNRSFHTQTPATAVQHFIRIPGSNDTYYVTPPVHPTTVVQVEMVYPASPTPITVSNWTTGTETINLPDIYVNPLLQLMLFRACDMLSSDMPGMSQKATSALALAIQMITGKADAETMAKARAAADIPPVMQERA